MQTTDCKMPELPTTKAGQETLFAELFDFYPALPITLPEDQAYALPEEDDHLSF